MTRKSRKLSVASSLSGRREGRRKKSRKGEKTCTHTHVSPSDVTLQEFALEQPLLPLPAQSKHINPPSPPLGIEQAQATSLSRQNHVHGQHCGFCLWRRPALPAPPPPEAGGTPPGTGGAQPALDGIIIGIKTSAARFEHKKNLFFRTSKYRRVNSN